MTRPTPTLTPGRWRPPMLRFHLDRALPNLTNRRPWILRVFVGPGAGYVTRRLRLPGFTLYVGRGVRGGAGDMYRPRRFALGLTRNANHVPWIAH